MQPAARLFGWCSLSRKEPISGQTASRAQGGPRPSAPRRACFRTLKTEQSESGVLHWVLVPTRSLSPRRIVMGGRKLGVKLSSPADQSPAARGRLMTAPER